MKREIKFRAWDSETKELSYDFLSVGWLRVSIESPYVELMQYTGLKDRNGKEIYEGDIVRIENHPFEGPMQINGNYEVGYNERMELCCGSLLLHRELPYVTVIGNRWDNPDLLEGGYE